ncbi:MAG: Ig-like domain-containing protein [Bacillota bacterium]|nr:Ig-like domain-containing protein [Bacillota bacterium]
MKHTIRKALALFMTIALVATTITFTAGNTLQAEEQAPPEVSQETSEPAKADAPATTPEPEKSEPVKETQTMNISQDEPDDEDYESAPADNEKKNPANEKKDNDKDKKGKKLSDSKAGLNVNVEDPEDALPDGTSIKLREVNSESIKALIQNCDDSDAEVKGVQAVDISFVKNGNKQTPNEMVNVTISGIDISGDSMALFHISGNKAEHVKDVSGNTVSFSAKNFSPYAVAAYASPNQNQQPPASSNGISDSNTVYVDDFITLTSDKGNNYHKWISSDPLKATVSGSGKSATVTGVAVGTVTITHEYYKWNVKQEEAFTVTVLEKQAIPATGGEINGKDKVEKYKTISLNLTLEPKGAEATSCIWYSSDDSVLTVDNSGKVTGVSEGTATVTAQVISLDGSTLKFTKEITVTEATGNNSASFFYLKTPTSDPASNSVDQWGDEDIGQGKISTSNLTFDGINAWISSDPGRVISWPAGFDGGNVPRDSKHWKLIYDAFSGTVGAVNEDDVETIILHPYKISNNNDGYHVDCTVELRVKNIYTATYYLWDAGETGYRWKFAENVRDGKTTSPSNASEDAGINNLPDTKTVNGRTYRLITWHDNAEQNGSAVEFPYTMTKNTNFYAKYIADYIVSYDLDGGTGSFPNVTKSEGDTVSVSSKIPQKAGYNFLGWQYGEAVYKGRDTFIMPASDVTLKALWERQYEVVIAADSDKKVYNGEEQSVTSYKVNGSDYKTFTYNDETYTVEATVSGSGKDVGEYDVNVTSYKIMKGDVDVTSSFSVTTPPGKLTITKRNVTITSGSGSKTYDGKPLTNNEVKVTRDGFANGEGASYSYTGSQTVKGISENTFTYTLNDNTEKDNYVIITVPGTLEVTPITTEIIITAASDNKKYDGKPLQNAGYTYTEGVLVSGDVLTAEVSGTITDAGSVNNVVRSYRVMNGTTDVTDCYTFGNSVKGTLTVSKRKITLTSGTAQKTYDGTPLTCDTVTESGDGFVEEDNPIVRFFAEGEGYSFNVSGTRTFEGTSKNTFTYTLNTNTKASNYDITKVEGDLTVTPITTPIVITADSNSKKYDGTPLTDSGFTYTDGVLVNGDRIEATVSGTITNAGTTANSITGWKVMHGDTEVTNCYTFGDSVNGTLTVSKRSVTLTSATESKVFDGTALTNSNVTVTGDGFVTGEGATYDVTGTQTETGGEQNNNVFTYTLNEGTNEDNYVIKQVFGTLTVTPAGGVVVMLQENSGQEVYDGTTKTVTGYSIYSVEINGKETQKYGSDDFRFKGDESHKTVSGIDVGTYDMGLLPENFENRNNNYKDVIFVIIDGQLKIKKNEKVLVVKADDATKTYDGTALSKNSYTCTNDDIIANSDQLVVAIEGSIKNVGNADNVVKSVKVMRGGRDVSGNYNIGDAQNGVLSITQRSVTITSGSDSKTYDGKPLTNNEVKVTGDGFANGEGATYNVTGTITDYGTELNTFITTLNSNTKAKNYAITEIPGTLKIDKAENIIVTISGNHDSFTYNGEERKVSGYEWIASGEMVKASDFSFNGSATASRTDEGTTMMGLTSDKFSCKSDNYKSMKFVIASDGYVEILPISTGITVTALNASKIYDGSALTADYKYTQGILVKGDVLTATVSGSQTDVGTTDSIVESVKIMRGDKDVTSNYRVETTPGKLRVNPRSITVTSASATKQFDGTPLTANSFVIGGDGMADGESLVVLFGDGQTAIGTKENDFQILGVTETSNLKAASQLEAEDVSRPELDNYDITTVFGTLTVTAEANLPAAVDNGDNGGNGGNGGNGNNGGTANPDGLVAGNGYNVTTIGDGQTPLAKNLLDLNCCILHLLIMLAAMLVLLWYTHDMKKRQRKIFELEEQLTEME